MPYTFFHFIPEIFPFIFLTVNHETKAVWKAS